MLLLPIQFKNFKTTFDIYDNYWKPFGELLTEIEAKGI